MSKMRDADMPLVERIGAAIERIAHGQAAMRVPVEATDPDVVLADCQRENERLTAERDDLRRQLAGAEQTISDLQDALRTAVNAATGGDAMKQDARRYRDWLRGGANIPPESIRWPRWEVRYWDGRYWNTLFAEQMDDAIDAAMGGGDAG